MSLKANPPEHQRKESSLLKVCGCDAHLFISYYRSIVFNGLIMARKLISFLTNLGPWGFCVILRVLSLKLKFHTEVGIVINISQFGFSNSSTTTI
jgi:hypothetical protein